MSDAGVANLRWAYTLLDGLAASGVSRVVLSPGSRSTPLALAGELHPSIQTWVQVDERSAAFFALGMARATQTPVALLATSGSAPTHWHPAVIEADQAGIPLLLLSADRPPELQNCGANQTINQTRLFQGATRAFHALPVAEEEADRLDYVRSVASQAVHESCWPLPGPVQINVPFREPLVPERIPRLTPTAMAVPVEQPVLTPPDSQLNRVAERLSGRPGLIIAGPGPFPARFAASLVRLAERLDCPVLADPLSGLRCGDHDRSRVLCHYDAFLRRQTFTARHQPQWVLRFGTMPVSKALFRYLQSLKSGQLFLVDPFGRWPDPLHRSGEVLRATPHVVCEELGDRIVHPAPSTWREAFSHEDQRAARLMNDMTEMKQCLEAQLVNSLLKNLPANSVLFAGNSMPIRELDSFSGSHAKALQLTANRGASGIDGQVSTVLGLASAVDENTTVTGLIGDLAFYHDMNGLLASGNCTATLVIINNGGGGIFRYLPQSELETFERDWLTPVELDFQHAASLYRLPFQRVSRVDGFNHAFRQSLGQAGVKLIEVVVDAQQSVAQHKAYWEAVSGD